MNDITYTLLTMQDMQYKEFQSKLIPTLPADKIIGIRSPILRKYAKELSENQFTDSFLKTLPHNYLEENNLHAFLIENVKSFDKAIKLTDEFLPYVDNWATCDGMSPKIFKKYKKELLPYIYKWLSSNNTYAVRFGILCLMRYYLEESFIPEYMETVSNIISDQYYVNMMISWYFATALAKQYPTAIKYLENGKLSTWIHNKTIQKAIESYRITKEQKAYLKTLKK